LFAKAWNTSRKQWNKIRPEDFAALVLSYLDRDYNVRVLDSDTIEVFHIPSGSAEKLPIPWTTTLETMEESIAKRRQVPEKTSG
jgi:hypothetical protein